MFIYLVGKIDVGYRELWPLCVWVHNFGLYLKRYACKVNQKPEINSWNLKSDKAEQEV